MTGILLVIAQAGLLYALWHLSTRGTRVLTYRLVNPFCWLIGFYALWFLLPQILYGAFDRHILGMAEYDAANLDRIYLEAQAYLLIFLAGLVLAAGAFVPKLLVLEGRESLVPMLRVSRATSYRLWLYAFLAIGLAGNAYIATQNVALLDGFRSEIIKSTPGRIATALSYFAAFAFAYLAVRSWLERRHAVLVLLVVLFAASILLTGARGRLLWPLLMIALFVVCTGGRLKPFRAAFYALTGFLLLLALDPLVQIVKFGPDSYEWSLERFFEPLVYKRNFDGFANFAMIATHDLVPHELTYLLTGARDAFMETYHARIYSLGVGFGATVPGLFWLVGGPFGLLLGGLCYGALLGGLNLWLRANRSNLLFWSYLFAMPWLCAVGGNLVESLDKMLAAMIGPVLIYLAHGGDSGGRRRPGARSTRPGRAGRRPAAPRPAVQRPAVKRPAGRQPPPGRGPARPGPARPSHDSLPAPSRQEHAR